MLNGKGTIILLTVGLIKKMMNSLKMLKILILLILVT